MSKKRNRDRHQHGQPQDESRRDDARLAREREEGNRHDREVVSKMRAHVNGKKKHGGEAKKPPFLVSYLPTPALYAVIVIPTILVWLAVPRELWMLVCAGWLTYVTKKVKQQQEWRGWGSWTVIIVMGFLSIVTVSFLGVIATVICGIKARRPQDDDEEDEEDHHEASDDE